MDDMKIFLINLDRQEQDTGSAWFTLPCDIEEMKETIGLPANSEHYLISDFSLPFEITENVDLSTINEVCMSIAGNDFPYEDIRFLQKAWFRTLLELRNGLDEITRYEKCSTMEEVSTYLINECAELGEVSPQLYPYINYKGYADTLETLGTFLCVNGSVYEYHQL